jgi:hypothetical protein
MHDATAIRTEGIDALPDCWPQVQVLVDAAYRGLANDHPDQVHPPPYRHRKRHPNQSANSGAARAKPSRRSASRSNTPSRN